MNMNQEAQFISQRHFNEANIKENVFSSFPLRIDLVPENWLFVPPTCTRAFPYWDISLVIGQISD